MPTFNLRNISHFIKRWNEFFQKHSEYNIIHGHVRSTASIYLKIAQKYHLVTIAHSHSTSSGKGITAIVKSILQYPLRYTADYLLACSYSAGKWLYGEKAVSKKNFKVLKNAINVDDFTFNKEVREYMRAKLNITDNFVIGHVGRFADSKNHSFLIDIFMEVYKKNKKASLLLVGDGELQTVIQQKVDDLGLTKNVIFTGISAEIPELLQAMDVFVFPSLFEGLGIVAIEAQASGLPCVVSDTLPNEVLITDIIKKENLNEGAEKWANQVIELMDNQRKSTVQQIKTSGYHIDGTSKWLEKYYLKVWNEKND